jgi:hypothetical protein
LWSSRSSSGTVDTGTGRLDFTAFQSFSGPGASFGPEQIAGGQVASDQYPLL